MIPDLEVDALDGAPGVYSAVMLDKTQVLKDNCDKLLSNLKDSVNQNRMQNLER